MEKMTMISEQVNYYLNCCENVRSFSKVTIGELRYELEKFVEYTKIKRIEDLTNTHIEDWIAAQRNGTHLASKSGKPCTNRTINTRVGRIVGFVRWSRDMGVIIPNCRIPLIPKLREDPVEYVFYSRETVNKVLTFADRRAWLMIRICFETGMRLAELTNLQLNDINGRMINLHNKAKCKEDGWLVMSEELRTRLDDWIEREKITDYIWPSPSDHSRPICKGTTRQIMRKPFLQAGLSEFHPHALRHSFATEIVQNGASDEEAQHMLRHSSFEMTKHYVHCLGARAVKCFDKYMFSTKETLR